MQFFTGKSQETNGVGLLVGNRAKVKNICVQYAKYNTGSYNK